MSNPVFLCSVRFWMVLLASPILLAMISVSPCMAQTDDEVKRLIDQLDSPQLAVRRQAAKTLDEYLRDNRLTPAQLSLLRTYPEVPTLEQRRRKEQILANWAIHFPALDQAAQGYAV